MKEMKHGDFTSLAENYAKYRPGYAPSVIKAIISQIDSSNIIAADVGAGTGIWSRSLRQEVKQLTAIEPNFAMLEQGKSDRSNGDIEWINSGAEDTTLESNSLDLVTMASSFHWPNFDKATKEFHRILKKNGSFCALWNPRNVQANPLLVEIEEYLNSLLPNMKRVSSGTSNFTSTLERNLYSTGLFEDIIYFEGTHIQQQSVEHYLGVWRSVNDIQVQLGPVRFREFISWIEAKVSGMDFIEATYKTKAWVAQKRR